MITPIWAFRTDLVSPTVNRFVPVKDNCNATEYRDILFVPYSVQILFLGMHDIKVSLQTI